RLRASGDVNGGVAGDGLGVVRALHLIDSGEVVLVALLVLATAHLHLAHLVLDLIVVAQHVSLDEGVQEEGYQSPQHWGEPTAHRDLAELAPLDHLQTTGDRGNTLGHRGTDDAADDGVGGGDRPALARGDQQPQCRTEQGGHHDVGEVLRVEVHAVQVDDAGADG